MATVIARSGTPARAPSAQTREAQAAQAARGAPARERLDRDAAANAAQPRVAPPPLSQRLVDSLGQALTRGNPVWTHQALGRMRALEQRLLEHGIQLPAEQRAPLLEALAVVESQVQLRLRLEQHRGADSVKADRYRPADAEALTHEDGDVQP
jgi:hypothetical protein